MGRSSHASIHFFPKAGDAVKIRNPAAWLSFVVLVSCLGQPIEGHAQEAAALPQPAKLRLVMKEPMATNIHVSVVDTGTCKSLSDVWITGGVKRFYAPRVGMLDARPVREGVVELEVPAG